MSEADRGVAQHHPHHHSHHHHHHAAPVFWPKEATLLLIELFKQNEARFSSGLVRKKLIWKEIAEHVQRSGHAFSWEQCEGRWKTLTAAYRRALLHNRCSQFHKELRDVLGYGQQQQGDPLQQQQQQQQQQQPRPIAPKPEQQQQQHPPPTSTAPSASSNPAAAAAAAAAAAMLNGAPPNVQGLDLNADGAVGSHPPLPPPRLLMPPKASGMAVRCSKKRRTPNSDILDWMAEFEDRQERRSREFLEKMERMHCEKISVITELITVMKDLIK